MIKLFLIGNLTTDPRPATTKNGKVVCNFGIAANTSKKNQEGERPALYVKLSAWGAMAEMCSKFLVKGRKVAVICSNVSNAVYQAKDGNWACQLQADVDDLEFLDKKGEAEEGNFIERMPQGTAGPIGGFIPVGEEELPF